MSFSFNFRAEDLVEGQDDGVNRHADKVRRSDGHAEVDQEEKAARGQAKVHTLEDVVQSLPSKISYSRTSVATGSGDKLNIYRRDLFDARFQMIDEDGEDEAVPNDNQRNWNEVMAGASSDLVPGVYEGGLKTWECSLDLVNVLQEKVERDHRCLSRLRKVTEIGCGTAYPSLYALIQVLAFRTSSTETTEPILFQLCDFNEQVLRLVTVPNILLNWYYNVNQNGRSKGTEEGELEISDELLEDFSSCLASCAVSIDLYSGFWEGLSAVGAFVQPSPDLVMTSETIYSLDTMPLLIETLRDACAGPERSPMCLVAAKVVYFGVGGGVYIFEQELRKRGAQAQTIWKSEAGVSRVVLQVNWT